MRVRIIRPLPAPLIDGFDVRGLRVDQIYDVDSRTARYLLLAEYAVAVDEEPEAGKREHN